MEETIDDLGAASPMPPQAPPSPPPSSSPSPSATYLKPRPRPPKSPAHSAQIRVQNRRREFLDRNPKYFESLEHELADPLLYDALIRRFQSPEEREKEGRTKGYSRVLEVDLLRGEAQLAQLTSAAFAATISGQPGPPIPDDRSWIPKPAAEDADPFIREYAVGGDGLGDDSNGGAAVVGSIKGLPRRPETKEEGRERWDDFLRRRFVLGRDDDFDYRAVDENDEFDVLERREQEDAWFDDEDPGWASDSAGGHGGGGVGNENGREKSAGQRELEGETGIQDF